MIRSVELRPIIFGEVLMDVFPDGREVLGGAPFNVAWHLRGFGLSPRLISRVGSDRRGQRIFDRMEEWNLDTGGIQIDPDLPTGTVHVTLEDGQPEFNILPDQAFDFIESDEALAYLDGNSFHLIYSGTLALRSVTSRRALFAIRKAFGLASFIDLNLRPPWNTRYMIEAEAGRARWLKMNHRELAWLIKRSNLKGKDLVNESRRLRDALKCELLIMTLGGNGAVYVSEQESVVQAPFRRAVVADTVGAGDAFSAVTIKGLLRNSPLSSNLREAVDFAAEICQITGAVPQGHTLYQNHEKRWKNQ